MADIGLAAFSLFFMQSPSFLTHQKALVAGPGRGRSNAHGLFAMTAIPSDNHIRAMLDGAPSDHFDPVFADFVRALDARGGLAGMRRLDGRVLIALDGSEHFRSRKISCPQCSTRQRTDGERAYFPPSSAPRWWRPATGRCCRCPRSSCARATARRNRAARAPPPSDGWRGWGRPMRG